MNVSATQEIAAAGSSALSKLEKAQSVGELRAGFARYNKDFNPALVKTVAVLGAAPEGQRLVGICRAQGIAVAALVDDDPSKIGTSVHGVTVEPSARLTSLDRATPVIIASHRVVGATQRLHAQGFATVLPFAALQILAPDLFRPHMFYDGWIEDLFKSRQKLKWLDAEVADQRSRQILDAVIQYRLTGDPLVLAPMIDTGKFHQGLYHPTGLFECSDDEVYVDAGAYDGDSLRWFKDRVSDRYERIIAFEPDPKTYARLVKNFAGEPRIEAINAGLHRKKAVLRFRDDASRGAIFADDGDIRMEVMSLDDILDGQRASFIKMNIEGAEIDALYGAKKTIQKWLPKLAISVYHRPSDLWRIPQIVREFNPDYDLYLRQHDGGVIETVLYAIRRGSKPRPV